MASTSRSTRRRCERRCAACSYYHRGCPEFCAGLTKYPEIISREDYHLMFNLYSVTITTKIFDQAPTDQRNECIRSFLYETKARIQDPSQGCAGRISSLECMVEALQSRVKELEERSDERSIRFSSGPSPAVKRGYMDLLIAPVENSSEPHPVEESLSEIAAVPLVPTSSPYLTLRDYEAVLARCYQASEAGCSSTPVEEVSHISPKKITELGSSDQTGRLEVDFSHFRLVKKPRFDQPGLTVDTEDLSKVEVFKDVSDNPIDLSALNEICNPMDQFFSDLDLDGLWETGTDQRLDQVGSMDSKGKAPMDD